MLLVHGQRPVRAALNTLSPGTGAVAARMPKLPCKIDCLEIGTNCVGCGSWVVSRGLWVMGCGSWVGGRGGNSDIHSLVISWL